MAAWLHVVHCLQQPAFTPPSRVSESSVQRPASGVRRPAYPESTSPSAYGNMNPSTHVGGVHESLTVTRKERPTFWGSPEVQTAPAIEHAHLNQVSPSRSCIPENPGLRARRTRF
ncbi:hypothetical protein E4U55_008185 [Claviceps digitariae]|nr:hypothetical protein E4U55_008185 [Claviceps digitariae]